MNLLLISENEFLLFHTSYQWECCLLLGVGFIPSAAQKLALRMRGVFQHIVRSVRSISFDVGNFLTYTDECVAESVQLGLVLRLGGLDHHRARYRPRYGRRVIA